MITRLVIDLITIDRRNCRIRRLDRRFIIIIKRFEFDRDEGYST